MWYPSRTRRLRARLLPATLNEHAGAIHLERNLLAHLDTMSMPATGACPSATLGTAAGGGSQTLRAVPNGCSVMIKMSGAIVINEAGG